MCVVRLGLCVVISVVSLVFCISVISILNIWFEVVGFRLFVGLFVSSSFGLLVKV